MDNQNEMIFKFKVSFNIMSIVLNIFGEIKMLFFLRLQICFIKIYFQMILFVIMYV